MNIPDDVVESFESFISELIEHASAVLNTLCYSEKHKRFIYISAPYFLIEGYQNYLSRKTGNPEPGSDCTFMGIRMIPSSDYAVTLFHTDYVVHKQNWMIRKLPLMPGLESFARQPDSEYKTFVKPFIKSDLDHGDPSLN